MCRHVSCALTDKWAADACWTGRMETGVAFILQRLSRAVLGCSLAADMVPAYHIVHGCFLEINGFRAKWQIAPLIGRAASSYGSGRRGTEGRHENALVLRRESFQVHYLLSTTRSSYRRILVLVATHLSELLERACRVLQYLW
jgi:hypothetical protein